MGVWKKKKDEKNEKIMKKVRLGGIFLVQGMVKLDRAQSLCRKVDGRKQCGRIRAE